MTHDTKTNVNAVGLVDPWCFGNSSRKTPVMFSVGVVKFRLKLECKAMKAGWTSKTIITVAETVQYEFKSSLNYT